MFVTVSKPKRGVRVRGTCPAGHTTEAEAVPPRVTWRGDCSHDGCTETVLARRIPRETPEAKATDAQPATDAGGDAGDPYAVREVTSYAPSKRASRRAPAARPEPAAAKRGPDVPQPDAGGRAEPVAGAGEGTTARRRTRSTSWPTHLPTAGGAADELDEEQRRRPEFLSGILGLTRPPSGR